MTKAQAQDRFNWKTKSIHTGRGIQYDVSISLVKGGANSIVLRNGKKNLFEDKAISYAIFKNRVMFRSDKDGYAISGNNKSPNGYVKIHKGDEELRDFIGDYDLKYDDFYELYYIEKE